MKNQEIGEKLMAWLVKERLQGYGYVPFVVSRHRSVVVVLGCGQAYGGSSWNSGKAEIHGKLLELAYIARRDCMGYVLPVCFVVKGLKTRHEWVRIKHNVWKHVGTGKLERDNGRPDYQTFPQLIELSYEIETGKPAFVHKKVSNKQAWRVFSKKIVMRLSERIAKEKEQKKAFEREIKRGNVLYDMTSLDGINE